VAGAVRIISIDPGRMTGYCYARIVEQNLGATLEFFPFQSMDDVDDLWRRLHEFAPAYIVCEDFEFRGNARTGLDLFPQQLIGIARLYELTESTGKTVLKLQNAAQGKQYYSDPILKSNKLYKRGIGHGMDATRHLLQWATFGPGYQFDATPVMLDTWTES
jgi:hypothetical protein